MKTILIPTDFSDNAWKAAGYAANLYPDVPSEFVFVHAFYEPSAIIEADIPAIISSRTKGISDQLSHIEKEFREFDLHPNSSVKTVARYGVASNVILDLAREEHAEVIIMGTTGASINENVVLGSTAMAVLETSLCPVLCIPADTKLTPPHHIMFATDHNYVSNLNELVFLKEIAELQKAKISIVNIKAITPIPVSANHQVEGTVLHNFLGDVEHTFFEQQSADVESGILNFANQKEIDLIVTLKPERGFWERVFHRSVSDGLGLHSNIPVLVLKG